MCDDKAQCIEDKHWCDSLTADDEFYYGCQDGSDEGPRCEQWECRTDYWKCADNLQCIEAKAVCDSNDADYSPWSLYGCLDRSDKNNRLCGCHQHNEWPCRDEYGCVNQQSVCDGIADCIDASDELKSVCENWNCSENMWKCRDSGKCVALIKVCDGRAHCQDGSDELYCNRWVCADKRWKCSDGLKCIYETSLCDGSNDCIDESDENIIFCTKYSCSKWYTKCADHVQCVHKFDICDGVFHCKDKSDELCDSPCLQKNLVVKSIVRECTGNSQLCFPITNHCDGVSDCPDGSDETWWACSCEDWHLHSCNDAGYDLCLHSEWVEINTAKEASTQSCLKMLYNAIGNTTLESKAIYSGNQNRSIFKGKL